MTERELLDRLARDVRDLVAHGEGILGVARAMCALDATPDDLICQRDEARRAVAVAQGPLRDALSREVEATTRADAAEATVRELRELCGEAGVKWAAYDDHAFNLLTRLLAAATPTTEGATDGR